MTGPARPRRAVVVVPWTEAGVPGSGRPVHRRGPTAAPPPPRPPPAPALAPSPLAPSPPSPAPAPGPAVDALRHESVVRPGRAVPATGWRARLFAATGGLVNPGVGAAEQARLDLERRVLIDPERLAPATHDAFLRLAALLAEGFTRDPAHRLRARRACGVPSRPDAPAGRASPAPCATGRPVS